MCVVGRWEEVLEYEHISQDMLLNPVKLLSRRSFYCLYMFSFHTATTLHSLIPHFLGLVVGPSGTCCMIHSIIRSRFRQTIPHSALKRFYTATMSVKLDSAEAEFISHLDAFAATQQPPVTCRIAGGWVRDKVRRWRVPS